MSQRGPFVDRRVSSEKRWRTFAELTSHFSTQKARATPPRRTSWHGRRYVLAHGAGYAPHKKEDQPDMSNNTKLALGHTQRLLGASLSTTATSKSAGQWSIGVFAAATKMVAPFIRAEATE